MPAADLVYAVKTFAEAWEIFKTAQDKISTLSKAFVEETRIAIVDVNGKRLIFDGIGYAHAEIGALLKAVGAPFNPQYVHQPPPAGMTAKEYRLSVRYPWAQDRVM